LHDRARAENDPPPSTQELEEGLKMLKRLVDGVRRARARGRPPAGRRREQLQLAADLGRDAA
jgi:hypothetical protein